MVRLLSTLAHTLILCFILWHNLDLDPEFAILLLAVDHEVHPEGITIVETRFPGDVLVLSHELVIVLLVDHDALISVDTVFNWFRDVDFKSTDQIVS